MSFNRSRGVFTCPPKCPERKPACQDHCERYARDKAKNEALKEADRKRREVDQYIITARAKKFDRRVKSRKGFVGYNYAKRG